MRQRPGAQLQRMIRAGWTSKYVISLLRYWMSTLIGRNWKSLTYHPAKFLAAKYAKNRRKIRLIEGKYKISSYNKNLSVKGLCGRCLSIYLGPEPHTPPPYTPYECIQYTYLHREGGEGRVEPGRGVTVHKAGSKIPTWLTVSPLQCINSDNQIITCRKVPLQVNFFRWRHFALVSI